MLNQVVLVGKFTGLDDDILEISLPKEVGSTEVNTYSIIVGEKISKRALKEIKEGDIIGIRGCLTKVKGYQYIKCEKLTFLSRNK